MQILNKVLGDKFLKNNLIFFIGSVTVGILSYAFHPVLSRLMTTEDYGELQALISLIAQIGIFTSFFGIIVINLTASIKDQEQRMLIISEVRKLALYISGIICLVLLFSSSFFTSFLQFKSFYPFLILPIMIPLSIATMFRNAFLQGKHNFAASSLGGIVSAASRLLFAALLVILGLKSLGAIGGMLLAQLVGFSYFYFKTRNKLSYVALHKTVFSEKLKKELLYGLLVLIVTSTITFLYTFDVLLVKHFFNPTEAGLYSGIAIVARILFFLNSPLILVLFSSVALTNSQSLNHRLLMKSLIIIMAIGGSVLLCFIFMPHFIIIMLMGSRYIAYASLLPKLGFLIFLVSITQALFYYNLALRRFFIIPVALAGVIIVLLLSYLDHSSMQIIIKNFTIGSFVIISLLLLRNLYLYSLAKLYARN